LLKQAQIRVTALESRETQRGCATHMFVRSAVGGSVNGCRFVPWIDHVITTVGGSVNGCSRFVPWIDHVTLPEKVVLMHEVLEW
jgi:hypothetical protein